MWSYFDGDYDYQRMQEKGVVATRQLAKRQLTWLRGWQSLNWLYTDSEDEQLKKTAIIDKLLLKSSQVLLEKFG
jgi:tRNA dimethylallyltransferase